VATKKDLVEAYSFSRRRLVTAFLSGAPGGREVEPSRPGRTVVGGLALAVLLVAGAAIASVLATRTPEDWNKIGLVVSREEPAPYVILDESEHPTLIPVINLTSVQLILGADTKATFVDQDVIEDQTPGDPIGIAGAPQTLPRPKQFIQSGWTSCTTDGAGVTTAVSADPMVRTGTSLGTVVSSGGQYWVLATSSDEDEDRRTYRYLLPAAPKPQKIDPSDDLLTGIGLNARSEAPEVPLTWLDLVPEGGELGEGGFELKDAGQPLDDPAYPPGTRVGDYIDDDQGVPLMLTEDGPSELSPFAFQVLQHSLLGKRHQPPKKVEMPRPAQSSPGRLFIQSHWPEEPVERTTGDPCARLVAEPGTPPRVQLGEDPQGLAQPDPDLAQDQLDVEIDPGHGAFFTIGDWDDDSGSQNYVMDPRGKTFLLVGDDTLQALGYDRDDAPVVPDSWLKLFDRGVELSTSKALCPPEQPGEEAPTPDNCQKMPNS
jgi:type VII secretion protein EccB